jgi:uncharacterized protein (TIGR02266 family)
MSHHESRGGAERRKHPRVQLGVRVDVVSGSNFYSAHGRDISMGGLFIETLAPLPLGSQVMVELVLGGSRHVLAAEVCWSVDAEGGGTAGVGVQFDGLSARARGAIERFMRRRMPFEFVCEDPPVHEVEVVYDAPPANDRGGWPRLRARSRRTAAG